MAILGLLAFVLLAAGAAGFGGASYTAVQTFRGSCSLAALRPVAIGENTFVYARNGDLLGAIPSERNRQPVQLERMSPWLVKAALAIEDRRFWSHDGLDYGGIARAAVANVREGRIVEGGSTITQQLVRSLYIGDERSFERKLEEACLAMKLEDAWPKDRILRTYLNRVFFGNHAYGAEAAAQTYFSKRANDLGPAQAALLAGLIQAPSLYDPVARPEAALARRNQVLRSMLDAGLIPQDRYGRAVERPLGLERGNLYTRVREPYFFEYVRKLLVERYGEQVVRGGGLRVHTTIRPRYQRLAREAIRETLDRPGDPASAIVSIEPDTGAIVAMTAIAPGNRGLQFNLAAQGRRQSGSAFKTFVLAEAVRRGINPHSTMYSSSPFTLRQPGQPEPWEVTTYDHSYVGPVPISQATLRSDNTVYARLTVDLGPGAVARLARQMGIETKLEAVPSIGLGSNSVSPLEMAAAYGTLASGGVYRPPMAIRRVVLPNGTVDEDWAENGHRRVLTQAQALEVTRILEQNMTSGTGRGALIGRPAAGKTGTTDEHTDAWFVGYTPTVATAVWVGFPRASIRMVSVHGIRVAGGTFPATIWGRFMGPALSNTPAVGWWTPARPIEWRPWSGSNRYVPPPPAAPAPAPEADEKEEDDQDPPASPPADEPPVEEPPADDQ